MRIWTPICHERQYFLTLYFREVGRPSPLRIGREVITFGKGKEHVGKLSRVQIEVTQGEGSIELFHGSKILGMVLADAPGVDANYEASLNPNVDEVELIRPSEVIIISGDLAKDIAGDKANHQFKKQLEVLNGKRKRFIGK